MYIVGEEEIEAMPGYPVGQIVPYGEDGECATFEKRYAAYLGVGHFALSASGTFALTAGLTAMGMVRATKSSFQPTPICDGNRRSGGWSHSGDRRRRRERHDLSEGHSRRAGRTRRRSFPSICGGDL